ncbi:MAG: hypothetical protein ABIW79_10160, partial [Gemmatimonas sp.]
LVERGSHRWQRTIARTPSTGWALAQSLVPVGTRHASLITSVWLLLLLLPLGYWGWWCRDMRAHVLLASAAAIGMTLAAAVRQFHVAFPTAWHWYVALFAIAAGMLLGQVASHMEQQSRARPD